MDRREFLLNTAKAAGVSLPWWGLLPISANAQTAASKILVYMHLDGGPTWDFFADPSVEPTLQPVYTGRAWRFPEAATFAGLRSATTQRSSPGSATRFSS